MEAKQIALAVALIVSGLVVTGTAQTGTAASADAAQARSAKYYSALQSGDFSSAWGFFGSRMRADTSRDEYVTRAKQGIKSVRVVHAPRVSSVTKTSPRPMATIRTDIVIVGLNGDEESITQTTEWLWQRSPDTGTDDWFLARDVVGPSRPAGTK